MRRVVRAGGFIVASVFTVADVPTAKTAIDIALAEAGWEPPDWYRFFKSVEGLLGSAGMRVACSERGARGDRRGRGTGANRSHRPARDRDDITRQWIVDECVAAVAERGEPFDPGVVLMAARA